jgi:hypothetical protein
MHHFRNERAFGRRRVRKDTAGQASVEFVLSSLVIVLLVFAIFEIVMLIYTYSVVADAAKEGVRYAIVHGADNASPSGPVCPCPAIDGPPGTGIVKQYAQYSFHDTSAMTVTVTYPDTSKPPANQSPNQVRVAVSYPWRPFLGFGWPVVTINAAAHGRIAY